MVFHWSLSDSKSPQVSRTRLSILAVLSNAVVWIVSTRPLTSKSSRPFNNPLVIVPNALITIGTIVTFMFHSFFFNSQARSRYLSFFSLSFRFILWPARTLVPFQVISSRCNAFTSTVELCANKLLLSNRNIAQSAGAVDYTNCFSAGGKTPHPTSVLDMTLNNLMVRLQ